MNEKFYVKVSIKKGELEKILRELGAAREKIYDCYNKLESLGLVEIIPEEEN